MDTAPLDRIKSTITLSLGTKNRLRRLKGDWSYEEYINYLIRTRDKTERDNGENRITIEEFTRKKGVLSQRDFKFIFSYNGYERSPNHLFDIALEKVRDRGREIPFSRYLTKASKDSGKTPLEIQYALYFQFLLAVLRTELDPLFRHRGRLEDHFSWEEEFRKLDLPERAYREDVLEALQSYEQKQPLFDAGDKTA